MPGRYQGRRTAPGPRPRTDAARLARFGERRPAVGLEQREAERRWMVNDRVATAMGGDETGFAEHGKVPRDAADAQPGALRHFARRERGVEHREQPCAGPPDERRERLRTNRRLGLPE